MKLKSSLPKEEKNGLTVLEKDLRKSPNTKHLALVVIDAAEVKKYPDETVTVEIVRAEAVPEDMAEQFADLLEQIFEQRTGKTRLDMGIEDDLDLRTQFKGRAKTPRERKQTNIFQQPEIGGAPAKPEDIIDAEVVDEEQETDVDATENGPGETSGPGNATSDEDAAFDEGIPTKPLPE